MSYFNYISDACDGIRHHPHNEQLSILSTLYGGKGASLAVLSQSGIIVPRGTLINHALFDDWSKTSGLTSIIDQEFNGMDYDDQERLAAACQVVREHIIEKGTHPSDLDDLTMYHMIGNAYTHYAVRSSAIGEDGETASFAGQHESFLWTKKADVPAKVRECWASLFTPSALTYRHHLGLSPQSASMGVVVQQMVRAEIAGVAFTEDPTGIMLDPWAMIEAVHGVGDILVSGEVTPTLVAFNVDKVVEDYITTNHINRTREDVFIQPGNQNKYAFYDHDQQMLVQRPTTPIRELSQYLIYALANAISRIRMKYGVPMDIEWAYKDDQLWILQARPLTIQRSPETERVIKEEGLVGQTASRGITRGEAWVLNESMNWPKDRPFILIAKMTKPEYLPAMLKAAGFATQSGGVTCHAAIVSRELGKPCVVGIPNLLSSVRTGMMVEVDGDNGTVRVL